MLTEQEQDSRLREALQGKINKLRERCARLGPKVVAEAEAMAKEVAEETGAPYQVCLAASLWGAQHVKEFLDPGAIPKLYRCPVCFDNGWQIVEPEDSGTKYSGARACPSCDLGLQKTAGEWHDRINPIGRGGKRYHDQHQQALFNEAYRHLEAQKAKILGFMDSIANQGSRRPQEPSGKRWD